MEEWRRGYKVAKKLDILDPWKDVSERHKVRILSGEFGGVTGLLPEGFSHSFSNTFEAPFADVLASFNTGLVAAQEYMAKGGKVDISARVKEMTSRIWSGSSEMKLSDISLFYLSRESALNDVMAPVRRLMQIGAPGIAVKKSVTVADRTLSGTVMKPPAPVMIELGYVLRMHAALITSLSVQWSNVSDSDGIPMSAIVTISISGKRAYVFDDGEIDVNAKKPQISESTP